MNENYASYVQLYRSEEEEKAPITAETFSVYSEIQNINKRPGNDLFYALLNKVFDRSEEEVKEILPLYVKDLVCFKIIDSKSFSKGLTKYLVGMHLIVADYPHLP